MSAAPAQSSKHSRVAASFRSVATIVVSAAFVAVSFPLLVWLVLSFAFSPDTAVPPPSGVKFDSQVWKSTKSTKESNYVRQKMVEDLLKSNILTGKLRTDVEATLGPRDETEYFRSYDMVYWLGPERGFMAIDSEWLVIKFDDHGKVAIARVVRD